MELVNAMMDFTWTLVLLQRALIVIQVVHIVRKICVLNVKLHYYYKELPVLMIVQMDFIKMINIVWNAAIFVKHAQIKAISAYPVKQI